MKRTISALIIVLMLLSLTACGSSDAGDALTTTASENTTEATQTLIKFLDSSAANGKYNWNSFSKSEQEYLTAQAEKEKITLDVDENGVMTVSDDSGLVITYGCDWPKDNSFMSNFPVPEGKRIAYTYEKSGALCLVGLFMSYDECKEYALNFESIGFDSSKTQYDSEDGTYYYYAAVNSQNMAAFIVLENGMTVIGVMPNN